MAGILQWPVIILEALKKYSILWVNISKAWE
jgi:hypothetical protein